MGYLDKLDLDKKLESKGEYEELLEEYQFKLLKLQRKIIEKGIAVAVAYEGCDAAGKGGNIKRITESLDPRGYEVHPIGAPNPGEKSSHWLRRFWLRLPPRGRIGIFDRTWYGRVLVERVEGYCSEADWMRAYGEITDFEAQLVQSKIIVGKFWLSISKEEQLRRFEERQATSFKRFKITDEDWRNREKWDAYESTICDMVERTSTEIAPWTLVESEDKLYGRIKILRTLCKRIEAAL